MTDFHNPNPPRHGNCMFTISLSSPCIVCILVLSIYIFAQYAIFSCLLNDQINLSSSEHVLLESSVLIPMMWRKTMEEKMFRLKRCLGKTWGCESFRAVFILPPLPSSSLKVIRFVSFQLHFPLLQSVSKTYLWGYYEE